MIRFTYESLHQFYEAVMNKDTLRLLPKLLEDMDQNLCIPIDNFISNALFTECTIDKAMLIEVVKASKDFHYDKKVKILKFKKKADLNMIIVSNFNLINEKAQGQEDEVNKKLCFLKNTLLLSCNLGIDSAYKLSSSYNNFPSKLKKIQYIELNQTFQIIFESEQWTNLAFNFFEELKSLNYFKDHITEPDDIKISVAAETLKRRILYDIPKSIIETCTFDRQKAIIKDILKDPGKYDPNKFLMDVIINKETNNKNPKYTRPSLSLIFQYQNSKLKTLSKRLNSTDIKVKHELLDDGKKKRLLSVRNSSYGKMLSFKRKGNNIFKM